jgi:hypothetical protein
MLNGGEKNSLSPGTSKETYTNQETLITACSELRKEVECSFSHHDNHSRVF